MEKNNSYNDSIYTKVYQALLLQEKHFSPSAALQITFDIAPNGFTKQQIVSLTYSVIDELLNAGMLTHVVDEEKGKVYYESVFAKQENKSDDQRIEDVVDAFRKYIGSKRYEEVQKYMTENGFDFNYQNDGR